jgi:hypothetical protein
MGFFRKYEEEDGGDTSKKNYCHNPANHHTTDSLVLRIVNMLPINLFGLWCLSELDIALFSF